MRVCLPAGGGSCAVKIYISGYISKIAEKEIEWHENTHFGHTHHCSACVCVCVWYNSFWYIPPAFTYCFLYPSVLLSLLSHLLSLGEGRKGVRGCGLASVCVDWRSQCDNGGRVGGW